jgi:hypothetical protein
MYEIIFFDIRNQMQTKDYKTSIVFMDVLKTTSASNDKNERGWFNSAFYAKNTQEIGDLMNKQFDTSPEKTLEILEKLKSSTVNTAHQFAHNRQLRNAPTADDFDRLVSLGQALMQDKENEASSSGPDFERNLADKISQAIGVSISIDTLHTEHTINNSSKHVQVISPHPGSPKKPSLGCKVQKLSALPSNSSGRKTMKALEFKI